jgi:hypothetical protein
VKNVILHILNKDPAIDKCSGQSLLILYGGSLSTRPRI